MTNRHHNMITRYADMPHQCRVQSSISGRHEFHEGRRDERHDPDKGHRFIGDEGIREKFFIRRDQHE